jgi:LysB family phage lysis regulatory protein
MNYLTVGGIIVALGLAAGLLWYRGEAIDARAERDAARAELATAVAVNEENVKTIERMVEQQRRNDLIILGLADELAKINAGLQEQNDAIDDLAEADESVRAYLATAIPDALRLQLNGGAQGTTGQDR